MFVYDAAWKLIADYSTELAPDPKVSYTTADHLGSPRILTDENGEIISRRDFHPFGEEISTTERTAVLGYQADDIRQKFTTYERDTETDLDFAQARMYKKSLGRFTSADELFLDQDEETPQSWNLYTYTRNNPLNYIDPSGQSSECPENRSCEYDDSGKVTQINHVVYEVVTVNGNPKRDDSNLGWLQGFRRTAEPWQPILETVAPGAGVGGIAIKGGAWIFRGGKWLYSASKAGDGVRRALPVIQKLCFIAGTPILTRAGLKLIEEIKEGDEVLSYNEKTKQNEFKTVVQTFERFAEAGRILSVTVGGEAAPLGVTHEHPFYVRVQGARSNLSSEDSDGEWVEAGNLRVGDQIRKADGT